MRLFIATVNNGRRKNHGYVTLMPCFFIIFIIKGMETKKKKKEFEEIMYVPAGLSIEEFSTLAGGVQQFHVQFHQCEKESVMPHLSRQRLPSLGL